MSPRQHPLRLLFVLGRARPTSLADLAMRIVEAAGSSFGDIDWAAVERTARAQGPVPVLRASGWNCPRLARRSGPPRR
jgi:hypothetical protein